jgi:hypothetical protein
MAYSFIYKKKELDRLRAINFMVKFYDFLKNVKRQKMEELIDIEFENENLNIIADILKRKPVQWENVSDEDGYHVELTTEEWITCNDIFKKSYTIYFYPLNLYPVEVFLYLTAQETGSGNKVVIRVIVKFNNVPWWAEKAGLDDNEWKKNPNYFLRRFLHVVEADPDLMIDSPELYEEHYNKIESMMKEMIRQAIGIKR